MTYLGLKGSLIINIVFYVIVVNLISDSFGQTSTAVEKEHILGKDVENEYNNTEFKVGTEFTTSGNKSIDNLNGSPSTRIEDSVEIFPSTSLENQFLGNHLNMKRNLQRMFEILQRIDEEECKKDMTYLLKGLMNSETWSLQLFDSLPKFPIGLLFGNTYQLGNFEECTVIKHEIDNGHHIKGQYCLAHIAFSLTQNKTQFVQPFQIDTEDINSMSRAKFNSSVIHWGICLPATCGPEYGRVLVKEVLSSLIDFDNLNVFIEDRDCYFEKELDTSIEEIIYGSIIALFLVCILLATAMHIWYIRKRKKYVSYNIYNVESLREKNDSALKEVILSFSLIQTVTKLLQTKPTELNLECICGIKFLSMMFIIAGHSLIFIFGSPMANADYPFRMAGHLENSLFANSSLMVDSFLLISGFLMCRLLLIELDKRKGRINFLILYVARYIRLTPAYLVILGFYLTWLPKIGDGPLWKTIAETENLRCKDSWWTNLLYINNYVQTDKLCMFQAWYLAADYHLFIIAPFLIYPLWKWPKTGISILTIVTISATLLPGYITYRNNLDPTLLAFSPEIQDISTNYYFANAYIKTHMRASSYFLGLIFGYVVHRIQTNCTKISDFTLWMGGILAVVFGICSMGSIVLFMDPSYTYNPIESAIYAPLHRVVWALAIGWVIVVCVTDNAGIVNKFLSWKLFMPLSRLTYCAYLVNGVVLISSKGTAREAITWTKLELAFTLSGHFLTTLVFAFVLCICFESPIHGLEKILLRKKGSSTGLPNSPATMPRVVEDNENK